MGSLALVILLTVFCFWPGQRGVAPLAEDAVRRRAGTALQPGLDGPRKLWALVFFQDQIVTHGVDILRVEKQAIHVKETSPDGRETGGSKRQYWALKSSLHSCIAYSALGAIV